MLPHDGTATRRQRTGVPDLGGLDPSGLGAASNGPQRRHKRIVPPVSPEARIVPSGENARAMTRPAWPTSMQRSRPVVGSHSLMVLSALPVAIVLPSGAQATALTS